ncbi:HlyC/CorC family transporter [Lactonifactor longoviformis]|uniref:Putative hemolysin n=1 Tax=Lactonifactor longoviformis DSM 17459 TaxID=1122155 RepID=A0A1M4T6S8_9CLOT|nr:hemolysin family protein [Lactonifactor longoviformis]POP34609.1 HlyC/CorC family transporter [Lactonifactor longoviformis]SHE40130.1 putative hemolysin [Lactonifactor longoviformis DSM 17459]
MDADPDGNSIMFQLLFLVFLTLVNAFFAGAEMAVVSVNKNKIKVLAEEGSKKAMLVQTLFEDSTKFLSTIQVAITFAGFLSSASAATGISQLLGEWLKQFGIPYSGTIAVVAFTILLSYFNLVFGELVPKRIALQKAEEFSMMTVKPIYLISRILSPFIKLLSLSTNGVLRLAGMKTDHLEEAVTEEEIKAMLEMGSEAGVFNKEERDMINSVFSFDDKLARDVMIPRRDVFAIDLSEPFEAYIDEVLESRHSRIPVYEESIDNIVGILHMKDFMIEMHKTAWSDLDIRALIHPAFFVPDSKNTDELFREMQRNRDHMAVLIDEYGGFSGIVTIEDLVEEIVGDINDEYDMVTPDIEKIEEDTYRLDGSVLVEEINEQLHLDLKTENYDTLSGFLIETLGYIPDGKNESVALESVKFIIEKMEGKRIRSVVLKVEHPDF